MRAAALLVLAACGGGKAAAPGPVEGEAPAGEPVRLTRAPDRIGVVTEETSVTRSVITFQPAGAAPMTMTIEQTEETRFAVLDVAADGIWTRALVAYRRDEQRQEMAGQVETARSPLHGNAYEVWIEDGELRATRDGAAAAPDELGELADDLDVALGRISPMVQVVGAHGWTVGVPYALEAAELALFAQPTSFGRIEPVRGQVTLTELGQLAIFALEMVGRARSPQAEIELAIEATGRVDRELRPLEVTTRGEITGELDGVPLTATLESRAVSTYF